MATGEDESEHSDQRHISWRVAILSDPHGDLVALQKVLSDLEALKPVDEVLVGGDLAQGGAQPAEVVDLIRERGWLAVRGNGDDLLVRLADGSAPADALRPAAATHGTLPESVASHALWSVDRLGSERIEYLRTLPLSIVRGPFHFGSVVLVHATPWSTEDVVLPDADEAVAQRMIGDAGARLLLLRPHPYAVRSSRRGHHAHERGSDQRLERRGLSPGVRDRRPFGHHHSPATAGRLALG
jgi:hypothetical protein